MDVVQHLRDIKRRCFVIQVIKEDATYASMLLPGWYVEVLVTPSLEFWVQVLVMLVTCVFPEPMKLLCILLIKICWCQVTTTTIPSLISYLCRKTVPPLILIDGAEHVSSQCELDMRHFQLETSVAKLP